MSNFFDKVKQSASDAADTVKDNVQQARLKSDMVRAYEDLGRKVFELVDEGKMGATGISRYVKHIKELREQLDAIDQPNYAKGDKKS